MLQRAGTFITHLHKCVKDICPNTRGSLSPLFNSPESGELLATIGLCIQIEEIGSLARQC